MLNNIPDKIFYYQFTKDMGNRKTTKKIFLLNIDEIIKNECEEGKNIVYYNSLWVQRMGELFLVGRAYLKSPTNLEDLIKKTSLKFLLKKQNHERVYNYLKTFPGIGVDENKKISMHNREGSEENIVYLQIQFKMIDKYIQKNYNQLCRMTDSAAEKKLIKKNIKKIKDQNNFKI